MDPQLPRKLVPDIRERLMRTLSPQEQVLGLFAVMRFRRPVSVLVVTDRRLLTLGDHHTGLSVVDEVDRAQVLEVEIERQKVFSTGQVTARTADGVVNLGTLNYDGSTFMRLEEVLAARPDGGLPVIPTPGSRAPAEVLEDQPVAATAAPVAHPLVAHLAALADLHARGALTDKEFAAAKARVLAEPGD